MPESSDRKKGMNRRAFLKCGGGAAVLGAAGGTAYGAAWMLPDTSEETPNSHQRATIEKIADTALPYDGSPGGKEAGAYTVIADPYYGINPYISEVVSDCDAACWWWFWYWKDFKNLSLQKRTNVLEDRLSISLYADAYEGMILLTKLAFFGGLVNTQGTNYIGFPGPSGGYTPGALAAADSCEGDCGGYGGNCWCDNACTSYADCCVDHAAECL